MNDLSEKGYSGSEDLDLDGRDKHFCIVASRYNAAIVDNLLSSAVATLKEHRSKVIDAVRVPGAFEIPLIAKKQALSDHYNAILTLGCVVRGETDHYDVIVRACGQSIAQIMLETGVPITLGILAVNDIELARARSRRDDIRNRGRENALVALEMAQLMYEEKSWGRHQVSLGWWPWNPRKR